jgi:DNA polymerase-3 subunit beta
MKFSVSKEKLLRRPSDRAKRRGTRTTLPILSNVLLQAEESHLRLTTTDLDVGDQRRDRRERRETRRHHPALRGVLATIVRELPASEISFEVDSKNVAAIRCGQSFFKILGLPEGRSSRLCPASTTRKSLRSASSNCGTV